MSRESAAFFAASVAHSVSVSALLFASGGLEVYRKVRDIENDSTRVYYTSYDSSLHAVHTPVEVVKSSLQVASQSGHVVLRAFNNEKNNEDKPVLEVFVDGSLILRVDASEVHGKIMADEWLGGGSFSKNDKYFTYVAAPKTPKPTTYFDKTADCASKYDYKEDWGELYCGVSALNIYVLDLSTGEVKMLDGVSPQDTPAQPSFVGDSQIVYTAYATEPKRLGLVYCQQRRCSVKLGSNPFDECSADHIDLTSSHLRIARSARVSPSDSFTVFLGSSAGFDTHGGAMQLYRIDLPITLSSAPTLLIDTVTSPYHTLSPKSFPGMYCGALHSQPFVSDTCLLVESQWRSCTSLLVIDISESSTAVKVVRVSQNSDHQYESRVAGVDTDSPYASLAELVCDTLSSSLNNMLVDCPPSLSLLAVSPACIAVLYTSSPTTSPVLLCLSTANLISRDFVPVIGDITFPAMCVSYLNTTQQRIDYVSAQSKMTSHLLLTSTRSIESASSYTEIIESILLLPPSSSLDQGSGSLPLVLVPHGGPHSAFSTAYIPQYTYLSISLGAAVLMGFGDAALSSLAGKIGTQDVADMMAALHGCIYAAKEQLNVSIDSSRVSVVGGSHGGFLGAHLIGQHPTAFRAAALRNPVTNIPAMTAVSDIADWTVIETCGLSSYDWQRFQCRTVHELQQMYHCSPIQYAEAVTAATLLCIGAKDRRVPASQGVEYYHILKARGVTTAMRLYPNDSHPIDSPASEADQFVTIKEWINQHTAPR